MTFNGPGRELSCEDHTDELVYCTRCGESYVSAAPARKCPACTLNEKIEALERRIEALEGGGDDHE